MKGRGSGWVTPSTLTCPSSMASSSADWALGEARFNSSASRMLVKIGPGWKTGFIRSRSSTMAPIRSEGSRSAVNWTRRQCRPSVWANALARVVLPTPGRSSMRRCPPAARQATARRTTSRLP